MRWAFVTTGRHRLELALEAILERGERPDCVITHEGQPMIDHARSRSLDVVTVEGLNGRERVLSDRGIELGVTLGWAELLGPQVLATPRYGWLNCHPSPLPAYRGSDPIGWQLVSSPDSIGLSIHQMAAHFDNGPIVRSETIPIAEGETRVEVERRLFRRAGEIVAELIASGPPWDSRPQTGPPSMCPPRGVTALIDPAAITASRALGVIRAFTHFGGVGFVGYGGLVHEAVLGASLGSGEAPGDIGREGRTKIACRDRWIVLTDVAETS